MRCLRCTISLCLGKEKQSLVHIFPTPSHQNKHFSFSILFIWTGLGGCPFHKIETITGNQLQNAYPPVTPGILYMVLKQMTCTVQLTMHHPAGPAHVRTIVLINTRKRLYEQGGRKKNYMNSTVKFVKKHKGKLCLQLFFLKSVRFRHLASPLCKITLWYNLNYNINWHLRYLNYIKMCFLKTLSEIP